MATIWALSKRKVRMRRNRCHNTFSINKRSEEREREEKKKFSGGKPPRVCSIKSKKNFFFDGGVIFFFFLNIYIRNFFIEGEKGEQDGKERGDIKNKYFFPFSFLSSSLISYCFSSPLDFPRSTYLIWCEYEKTNFGNPLICVD